jgi:hypothetical protein
MSGDAAGIDATVDAHIPGPCWPIDTTAPGGAVEVGTGVDEYQPMPDSLPLVYGEQMGYHITARSRIRGLNPGPRPPDVLNPQNPRTKFNAIALDTGEYITGAASSCPYRIYYDPAADGDGDTFPAYIEIRFDTALQLGDIVDKQYRVIVEVIDADGKYAKAEKVITATAPQN